MYTPGVLKIIFYLVLQLLLVDNYIYIYLYIMYTLLKYSYTLHICTLWICITYVFIHLVLGIEARALSIPGICSTTELHYKPLYIMF